MKTETICQVTPCDRGVAERPRYYARQLITSDDLTLEQEYFRNKLRAHNRMLHGWGVVCGAHVCPYRGADGNYQPWEVVVEPGYILGPYGDEIVIDRKRVIPLRTAGVSGATGDSNMETVDPWCSEVYVPRSLTGDLFVAVRYRECQARPVRVQPVGCSCEDNPCEYSRLQDGYEISVLDHCPEGEIPDPRSISTTEEILSYLQSIGLMSGPDIPCTTCLPCPPEPWVVLAKVTVDNDGVITQIDNCECRRRVISFACSALRCHTDMPSVTSIAPDHAEQGKEVQLKIKGSGFKDGMKVNLGPGIAVKSAKLDPGSGEYTVEVRIDDLATPGDRAVTLINPGCDTATSGKFTVDRSTVTEVVELAPHAAAPAGGEKRRPSKRKKP
jgi:hypothetical protein